MTRKRLKSNASKVIALTLAGALVGTGAAIALGNSVTLLTPAQAAAASNKYVSDYSSKQEAIDAGYALNIKVAEEGIVLLKNINNTLPLLTTKGLGAKGVTVFGYAGAKPQGGSGANGGDTSSGQVGNAGSVYDTLAAVGYRVNPYVRDFYNTEISKKKTSDYKIKDDFVAAQEKLAASYSTYGDAAVVVLNVGDTSDRYNAETNPDGISYDTQYDSAQYALIEHATQHFDKVIVVINKAYPVELDKIKKNTKVGAIINVNEPGTNGLVALGSVMCGDVNPSGRLADTFSVDQTKDPAYVNFPNKTLGNFKTESGQYAVGGSRNQAGFTDYEEGIYVGYRYWETRAYEEKKLDTTSAWYDDNVSYTFGYGLSYTNFKWTVKPHKAENSELKATDVLKFDVTVKNEGNYAGKDVVQLYLHAPYYDGEIEKAEVVLEDFAKTELLQPQQEQTLTLSVKVKDLASYDWSDANKNGHRGYELDNGDYELRIMHSAHYDAATDLKVTYKVNGTQGEGSGRKGIFIDKAETGYTIENQFEYMNAYASGYSDEMTDKDGNKYSTYEFKNITNGQIGFDSPMSRASTWTKEVGGETLKGLQVPATAPVDIITTQEKLFKFAGQTFGTEEDDVWSDTPDKPWYVDEDDMPDYMTAEEREAQPRAKVTLSQLTGKAYDDPLWEDLLDELTLLEMQNLINYGGWNTGAIEYIGKPATRDTDGPKGWTGSGIGGAKGNMICAEPMVAATFNTDLIYEVGKNMGDQGLWGSTDRTDGGAQESYTCWYAPGMNLHRGPFDSRLAEYYSEDPVLMGKMAAAISLGMRSKGGYITMKHFALHQDGRTVRSGSDGASGLYAWLNEQALRELYLRSYQICASEGEANDAMASFTRFGYIYAGASWALNTAVFRGEWGCNGYVVSDICNTPFQNMDQMIRAGGNLRLIRSGTTAAITLVNEKTGEVDEAQLTATRVTAMRNACKGILWSVANSNAMQVPPGAEVRFTDNNKMLKATVDTEATFELNAATLGTTRYAYSTITYAVTNGNLPLGLTINRNTGVISGTPSVAGVYNVTVTASADGYTPASVDYTIVIGAAADDYSAILEAIEALDVKAGDVDDIKAQLAAIKSAIEGSDISETDLSKINAKISSVEAQIAAVETKADQNAGAGTAIALGAVGLVLAVIALGGAVFLVVKGLKKNEK